MISIHAPSRERHCRLYLHCQYSAISIHAPLRELPGGQQHRGHHNHFNPRSLAGATTIELQAQSSLLEFQSTLPYGSDDITLVQIVRTLLISIHAPLRERLIRAAIEKEEEHISILAPSRERHAYVSAGVTSAEFQSSLPRGSDNISTMMGASVMISIHAPSRERLLE